MQLTPRIEYREHLELTFARLADPDDAHYLVATVGIMLTQVEIEFNRQNPELTLIKRKEESK